MTFENIITSRQEIALSDKLLAKDTLEKIRLLIKKDELTLEEMNEILYLLASDEIKLLNFSYSDRYILGKFYAWIREFVKLVEEIQRFEKDYKKLTDEQKITIQKIKQIMSHNFKFLVDVFAFLARSTMSINSKAFEEFLKQKYEYEYSYPTEQKEKEKERHILFFKK
ncbi:MAG: hypothetical protein QW184_01310 [Nanopusillaceae archaeon]